jgi:hypothetical protein
MLPDELRLVESALRSQFGRSAELELQDRTVPSRMNLVLDRAEKDLGRQFCTVWVRNGPPEIFCLRGFSEPVIAFCPRYLEMWADLHRGMVFPADSELKQDWLERLILRIIAELSLSRDNPDFAGSCILRGAMDESRIYFVAHDLMALEDVEFGFSYMACWFYGLTHEMGHFWHPAGGPEPTSSFTEEFIDWARDRGIRGLETTADIETRIRAHMIEHPNSFLLGAEVLRNEMVADFFATITVLLSTTEILKIYAENSGSDVDWGQHLGTFVSEMLLSLVIVGLLERCRRIAEFACTAEPERQFALEMLSHPAAISARIDAARDHLRSTIPVFLYGREATKEQSDAIAEEIESCTEGIDEMVKVANVSLGRATRVCLDREHRLNLWEDARRWQEGLAAGKFAGRETVVLDFLERSRAMGKWAPDFTMIQDITADPSAKTAMKFNGDELVFQCLWVKGPDGFSRPFGLDTRHGHLIFVFAATSKRFDILLPLWTEDLIEGLEMKSAAIIARNEREIRSALALHLPVGFPFQAAVEGTPEFEGFMDELGEGTIWKES